MCAAVLGRNLSVERLESRLLFAAGDIDTLFAGGKVVKDIGGASDFGFAVVVQTDGKVLVAGRSTGGATGSDFSVVRFNSDGSVDSSFGTSGVARIDMGSASDSCYAILVQPDGKIILGGETTRTSTSTDFALARLNTNGSLDTSFGTAGKTVNDFFGGTDQLASLALTSDGHILAGGTAKVSGLPQFAVAEFTSAGALESGFGIGGKVTRTFASGYSRGQSVAVLGDGSIVLAGGANSFMTAQTHFAAIHFSSNGAFDSTFGASGWAIATAGGDDETVRSLLVQSTSKLVLVGESFDSSTGGADFAAVRLNANGTLDSTFGSSGVIRTDFAGDYDQASSATLQSDGKIVIAGFVTVDGDSHFGIQRLTANGALDTSFAGTGMTTVAFNASDVANAVALDAQGKIVVAGFTMDETGAYDFAAARVIGRTNLAPTANPGGAYTVAAGGSVVLSGAGSVDSDGQIVVYEWDYNYNGGTFDVDGSGVSATFSAADLSSIVRTIALRVTDNEGATSIVTTTVTVGAPPPPPTTNPPPSNTNPPTTPPAASGVTTADDPANAGKKILSVHGTAKKDHLKFSTGRDGLITVKLNCKTLGKFASISKIVAYGEAGDDLIDAHESSVPVALFGGAGNDMLIGSRFDDTFDGGSGRNCILDFKVKQMPRHKFCIAKLELVKLCQKK